MRRGEASVFALFLTLTLCLLGAFGIAQGGLWLGWHSHHRHVVNRYQHAVNQNRFWQELDGERSFTDDIEGHAAKALRPFLKSQTISSSIESPLVPKSMAEIVVPNGVFDGMDIATELCIAGFHPANQDNSAYCDDSGKFNPDFMEKFQQVLAGNTHQLLTHPTSPQLDPFTWWPTHQSNPLMVWGMAYILLASLSLGVASLTLRFSDDWMGNDDCGRWPNFTFNGNYTDAKWAILLMVPWYSLPRAVLLRTPAGFAQSIRTTIARNRAEQETMHQNWVERQRQYKLRDAMPNIVRDAWEEARVDLGRMNTLGAPTEPKAAKEWKKVHTDLEELIGELEGFPDELSDRAKVLVARQIARRSPERRDATKAQLAALDELEQTEEELS